jgi:hypothetical protein
MKLYCLSIILSFLLLNVHGQNIERYTISGYVREAVSRENPFSEATPAYSNVNGGFGIFTSYTIDSFAVRLK